MNYYDDEYLEIFGGDEMIFNKITTTIKKTLFDPLEKNPCNHSNIDRFPNKEGYCIDCGSNVPIFVDKSTKEKQKCNHENNYEGDNGLYICKDCNEEIEIFNFEPEWRYYQGSDNSSSKDPARCHRGRPTGKSLSKMFEELKIDILDAIKTQVESKYNKVVGTNTVRGKGRKSIVAACLFYTYRDFGEYRTSDYVRNLFKLTKKNMSDGLSDYYKCFPEARIEHTTPENLLRWIFTLTGLNKSHYRKVVQISRYLENSSRLLERSSPQSVASAIVYFYLCLFPQHKFELGLTKNKFAEKALLSDITVTKLVREAATISQCIVSM
jgi:transcription initiation factor TFIIIB Brf1 subunit/transcription initiation factor TFIIB